MLLIALVILISTLLTQFPIFRHGAAKGSLAGSFQITMIRETTTHIDLRQRYRGVTEQNQCLFHPLGTDIGLEGHAKSLAEEMRQMGGRDTLHLRQSGQGDLLSEIFVNVAHQPLGATLLQLFFRTVRGIVQSPF